MTKELQKLKETIKRTKQGKRREGLQQLFEHCNCVYDNLSFYEMELIWYIRQSKKYRAHSYLIIAKKIYEAELALNELLDAAYNAQLDKK